ncbi:MAG: hypothetical protein AAB914_03400 [Patescibacteria group bacterium]
MNEIKASLVYPTSFELGLVACKAHSIEGFDIKDGVLKGLMEVIRSNDAQPKTRDLKIAKTHALAKVLALAGSPDDLENFSQLVGPETPQASFMQSVYKFVTVNEPEIAAHNEILLAVAVNPGIKAAGRIMIDLSTSAVVQIAA